MDVYRTGAWETVACDFSAAGYRLPTMAEWEFAARGGLRGKRFPWGDEIDPTKANYGCNVDNVSVAGTYPANGYGLFDIVGNLWHWTWDRYPEESQQYRSLRGGSWLDSSNLCECAFAGFSYPGLPHYTCSFRTVMATTGP
jgi:formylglycine-generating enzyme required for sulfatase activity